MENLLKKIEELRERLLKNWRLLNIDRLEEQVRSAELKMGASDFWNDREKAVEISKEAEDSAKEVEKWKNLRTEIRELEELVAVAQNENDITLKDDVNKKYRDLRNELEKLEFTVLFSGDYDESNTIVSIHAGTGGVDAQDWAEILERMFLRFAEKMNWNSEVIDRNAGAEDGIKNSTIQIKGKWAYGYFKSENGVHRLVRISPFDAEQMRHTSFALVEVLPELDSTEEIELRDEDVRIDVYKSSGPGGQGVNTTDSAVRVVHIPSNITVTCQSERSQHQNRERAIKILKSKLHKLELDKKEAEEAKLKGKVNKAEWGKQIRSYVMQPYKMVKDHRTGFETQDIDKVLDGSLDGFMESYLRWIKD